MDSDFAPTYRRSVSLAPEFSGRFSQAFHDAYPAGKLCVTGNAAEITRVRFRLLEEGVVTAKSLARFTSFQYADQLETIPFVTQAWENWLSRIGETYNVHAFDLSCWEHWAGNFTALEQTEMDIAVESFTPYTADSC